MVDDLWPRVEGSGFEVWVQPLSAETLEPLACFVGKLPKDSDFADEGFPGLKKWEFLGLLSTEYWVWVNFEQGTFFRE